MTLKELKKMEIFKAANKVIYHNADGKDVTRLINDMPTILTDRMEIIGTSFNADGTIDIDIIS